MKRPTINTTTDEVLEGKKSKEFRLKTAGFLKPNNNKVTF